MSELSSRPAREPMVYTLEQVATIPEKQWHAFVLAVTEILAVAGGVTAAECVFRLPDPGI